MNMEETSRRSFLKRLVWAVPGLTFALFAVPIVRYILPIGSKEGENFVTDAQGNPLDGTTIGEGGSFVGLSRDGPTIIVRHGGRLKALSAVCPHLGCLVKWLPNEEVFLCPCHAGRFDANGVVISGPPPSPLPTYATEIDREGRIILKKT